MYNSTLSEMSVFWKSIIFFLKFLKKHQTELISYLFTNINQHFGFLEIPYVLTWQSVIGLIGYKPYLVFC